jgi:hypothetical protein
MQNRGETNFDKAGKFLLNLAMLVLLAIALCKVIIPEVRDMLRAWKAAPSYTTTTADVSTEP